MKNIGLIGCGNIAETYFRSQEYFNNIQFISCADVYEEASKKCAKENNINYQIDGVHWEDSSCSLEEIDATKDFDRFDRLVYKIYKSDNEWSKKYNI